MSGGRYNYLCFQDPIEIHELSRMADRLEQLAPGSAAAQATRAAVTALCDQALRDVWHDVEWYDSMDYGREQALAEIQQYEEGHR